MAVWSVFKWGLPILNLGFKKARVGKRAQKIFEKLVGENQAAGLSIKTQLTTQLNKSLLKNLNLK